MKQPFRVEPMLPVEKYITYGISASRDTGVVTACKDAGCQAWQNGWETIVDESTVLGANQAAYIRRMSGRTFKEAKTGAGTSVFRFEPFQRCFSEHRTRPDVYVRRHGDWRGNPSGQRFYHANAAEWVEDFQGNQARINSEIQKG
jgi:hypothetical protein